MSGKSYILIGDQAEARGVWKFMDGGTHKLILEALVADGDVEDLLVKLHSNRNDHALWKSLVTDIVRKTGNMIGIRILAKLGHSVFLDPNDGDHSVYKLLDAGVAENITTQVLAKTEVQKFLAEKTGKEILDLVSRITGQAVGQELGGTPGRFLERIKGFPGILHL